MSIFLEQVQSFAEKFVDYAMDFIPRETPTLEQLNRAKIIAHRGNGFGYPENSLAAFRAAHRLGVYGIEFDVRFTKDDVPVISHDETLKRCFGSDHNIETKTFAELKSLSQAIPPLDVPTLDDVVQEFGGKLHLMIELKSRRSQFTAAMLSNLKTSLSKLQPALDYHFMSLCPSEMYPQLKWAPREACLSISIVNASSVAKQTLDLKIGGHTGHYVLVSRKLQKKHELAGQKIGTGFISRRSVLVRELARNVEWLFTDCAPLIQSEIEALKTIARADHKTSLKT